MQQTVYHWADQLANRIISTKKKGKDDPYILAAGITPSGTIHIGNFRELITVDFVKRALEKQGKKIRFIFSWDDYDVFRKIPNNMPNQEVLKDYLGKSIINTPDPFGQETSYASHHEKKMENAIEKVAIFPEFIYQAKEYQSSRYAKQIQKALENTNSIKKILNEYRKEPLSPKWLPISIFCNQCQSNDMKFIEYLGGEDIKYDCNHCNHKQTIQLSTTSAVKLLWRVDWCMRWAVEGVDFEPGGKDHSSEGGSFDTAKKIAQAVYHVNPPIYQMYDFIRIKGKGGKISSSSGEVVTLDDVLEIYEPEIVRWVFSSYKMNVEFAISFDLDVIKIYEDYDRIERKIFEALSNGIDENNKKSKSILTSLRAYELAQIEKMPEKIPYQPSFRHLCNLMQINDFDYKATLKIYENDLKTAVDNRKFKNRFFCAKNWIEKYAPEDFKFSICKKTTSQIKLKQFLKEQNILQSDDLVLKYI